MSVLSPDEVAGYASVSEKIRANGFPDFPPAVSKAITQVMAGAKKLGKDESNPFAHYKYAGIDAFLEMLGPLCAEAGLIIIQDEEDFEFREGADKSGKVLAWLVQRWAFGLAHSSGPTWPCRIRRGSMVQASMGSQSFGAGQSYALKSFLRQIGMIPTGDAEDADSHEQRELPAGARGKVKTKADARQDGDYTALEAGIRNSQTKADLEAWAKEHAGELEEIPDSWQKHLRTEYARHLASLVA